MPSIGFVVKPERTVSKLNDILSEFEGLDERERFELLAEFSRKLPELPERYKAERDAGLHRVPECRTPVFLWIDLADGRVDLHAYVAPEAPTVVGFVAILLEAFQGATPDQVEAAPNDLLERLGIARRLGMTRLPGLNAVLQRVKSQVRKARIEVAGSK